MQASSNQGGDVSGPALEESSSATPAGTSGGTADPTDAPDATTRPVTVEAADLEDAGAEALPFTGWTPLPMMLLAVLAVIAGGRLRRAARNVA